jgi:hypothetical protein
MCGRRLAKESRGRTPVYRRGAANRPRAYMVGEEIFSGTTIAAPDLRSLRPEPAQFRVGIALRYLRGARRSRLGLRVGGACLVCSACVRRLRLGGANPKCDPANSNDGSRNFASKGNAQQVERPHVSLQPVAFAHKAQTLLRSMSTSNNRGHKPSTNKSFPQEAGSSWQELCRIAPADAFGPRKPRVRL